MAFSNEENVICCKAKSEGPNTVCHYLGDALTWWMCSPRFPSQTPGTTHCYYTHYDITHNIHSTHFTHMPRTKAPNMKWQRGKVYRICVDRTNWAIHAHAQCAHPHSHWMIPSSAQLVLGILYMYTLCGNWARCTLYTQFISYMLWIIHGLLWTFFFMTLCVMDNGVSVFQSAFELRFDSF